MRRGKPQQQIYRPGSGPLRRSGHNVEDTESDTGLVLNSRQNYSKGSVADRHSKQRSEGNLRREQSVEMDAISCKGGDYSTKDDCRRKPKKPDQTFYVPKPVAQAQARESSSINRSNDNLSQFNIDNKNVGNKSEFINGNLGGSNEHLNTINTRSKRYSNRRRPSDTADMQERGWRANSPVLSQRRDIRQGSEPRAISQHSSNSVWNHGMRDTRSVEPAMVPVRNYVSDKFHLKPPSGRRHSTIGLEPEKRPKNLEALPPRLRKKYLEDNKMNVNYIGTHSEGNWDGNSLVFQGSAQHPPPGPQHKYLVKQNYSSPPCVPMPMELQQQNLHIHNQHHQHHMPNNYQNVYYTLPHRGRGRARMQHEYDSASVGGFYRCVTPDRMQRGSPCNSRPATPPMFNSRTRSNENLHRSDSRPQTPVQFFRRDKHDRRPDDGFSDRHDRMPRDRYGNQKNVERNSNKMSNNERRFGPRGSRNVHEEERSKSLVEEHPRTPFRESLEAQLSPVSPATPPELLPSEPSINLVPVDNQILDWSEEVELQVRLEAEEAFSDAVTRSSSMTSLVETSTASQPPSSRKRNKRKSKRNRKRSGSKPRENSTEKYPPKSREEQNRTRKNSHNSIDSSRDNFKVPEGRARRRRDSRDKSFDQGCNRSRNVSRESSFDRSVSTQNEPENWRDEILRSRHNSERESSKEPEHKEEVKKGGIIILPHKEVERSKPPVLNVERPRYPEMRKPTSPGQQQKSLFDPNNPSKPIIVKSSSARVSVPGFSENAEGGSPPQLHQYTTDQFGNIRPLWYDEKSDGRKLCHFSTLLNDIKRADHDLQCINNSGLILINWATVVSLRRFLMDSLEYLLCKDLKFCQSENVEQHFWKILYYNIIEMMRKTITNDPSNKKQYNEFLLWVIDEGTKYFENLLDFLERTYKFKLNDYLGYNNLIPQKGLGYVGLALISAQKIFLFLGDLARYKEQVNETSNYGKCRQWYIKAHEINPKNGKPYNQLAVLAVYARRKLDAVYYYMRSLMSSNPVPSARESLISLFDENRKKYEQGERKRREERQEKARQHMKEKESETAGPPGSLRREIWIRPGGGRRVHRTTPAIQEPKHVDSEEEDLAALSCLEVNKRFVTSYLHVHGKLINKIGMESFQEAALQMLKEFRALLQHSPMPLNCNRFLQLLALNMFAIESTQLKDPQFQDSSGYRSELQERALVISLQMFNLILERSVSLLHDHLKLNPESATKLTMNSLPQDFHMLLPAVKTWCDWMLCHSSVWNPPPSTQDYRVGPPGDAWSRLASLMNLLEKLDQSMSSLFIAESREGFDQVRLPEDAVLSGFTPLMYNEHEPTYVPKEIEPEIAQCGLRLAKVLFFGTVFLCGLEPPVLKLEMDNDFSEYLSVVSTSANRDSPPSPPELIDDDDLLVESFSEDECDEEEVAPLSESAASSEVRQLLSRKVELEKRQRTQELHRQRVQKILQQSVVSVHIEIRPKILVPDTNCFIDYLAMIKSVVGAHVYTLMVPLVVLNELEGLARGGKCPTPSPRAVTDPQHVLKVADSAKHALEYLGNRHSNIKCVTTKGTTLPTFTFTVEEDSLADAALRNDDKILATCLMLCKNNKDEIAEGKETEESVFASDAKGVVEPRKLYREVVLLTEDRNLRVKALARDLPVRELPDFLQWAGLG